MSRLCHRKWYQRPHDDAFPTNTPGLDSAVVLRTAAVDGASCGFRASPGIVAGCLSSGGAIAAGLGALLKWIGVCYLVWLGVPLLCRPRGAFAISTGPDARPARRTGRFMRGLLRRPPVPRATDRLTGLVFLLDLDP